MGLSTKDLFWWFFLVGQGSLLLAACVQPRRKEWNRLDFYELPAPSFLLCAHTRTTILNHALNPSQPKSTIYYLPFTITSLPPHSTPVRSIPSKSFPRKGMSSSSAPPSIHPPSQPRSYMMNYPAGTSHRVFCTLSFDDLAFEYFFTSDWIGPISPFAVDGACSTAFGQDPVG